MNRLRRTLGVLPIAALLLAACAAPGSGGGDTASPIPSATDGGSAAPGRVDIGDLHADPAAFAGQDVRILGRVDTVLVEDAAFLTSPSGEEDGLLVVVADGARVDKAPVARSVLWITGTVVPLTAEDLAAAGALVTTDDAALADVSGEYAIVATELADPLTDD
jgi:hypothetical protein